MEVLGSVLGLLVAVALHIVTGLLRRRVTFTVAIVGWVVAVAVFAYGALMVVAWLRMKDDPHADMGPVWGMLAVVIGVLLLACAGLGLVHRRRFAISWWNAFGVIMAEAGAALAAGLLFNELLAPISDIFRGGNQDTEQILAYLDRSRDMGGNFNTVIVIALLLLTAFAGRRARPDHARDAPAA